MWILIIFDDQSIDFFNPQTIDFFIIKLLIFSSFTSYRHD